MKTANNFLEELNCTTPSCKYDIINHPAKKLDEYMKEQYGVLLISPIRYCVSRENKALSYILYIMKCIGVKIDSNYLVKNVFSIEKYFSDYAISFLNEEIKYLLGFELYILSKCFCQEEKEAILFIDKIMNLIEIDKSEQLRYEQIYQALEENDLDCYEYEECYLHSSILSCYLCNLNFDSERDIAESNAYPNFPVNKNYIVKKFGNELRRISYFDFVIRNENLGNIPSRFYGIQVRKCSEEEAVAFRHDEYKLKMQKPTGNQTCEGAVDIGGIYIFYNYKNSFNAPEMVISHPLDYIEGIEEFLKKNRGICHE